MIRALSIVFICAAAGTVWAVWHVSLSIKLDRLAETGALRVEQAAERLVTQLDRYRILANVLAGAPKVRAALSAGEDAGAISDYLRDHVLTYGAERIELIDRAGTVIATSDLNAGLISRRGDRIVRAAMTGRLGLDHVLEARMRQFRFSRGVVVGRPPPRGTVLIYVSIAALEYEWSLIPESIGFFDAAGVVFVSNRPSLLLHQDQAVPEAARFPVFPAHTGQRHGPHEIWYFPDAKDLPARALVLSRYVPHIDMTVRGFLDIAPARAAARLQALLAAAGLALLGLAGMTTVLWRRRVSDRLALEAAVQARLEARVEERTAELQATQHQLVQASKMTALGQMSAGISHELNQPLAAIMNFADNARRFLELGRPEPATENLGHISSQVQRITRIIQNLRGFARAEDESIEPVDLKAAVDDALALVETALDRAGVSVHRDMPSGAVVVMGGKVRLQQVVVNLLTNAVDAMADSERRCIFLTLTCGAEDATLSVRDTGSGIAEPGRVFEPFYTTKELGASKGLGLGLSISYGMIGSFGGDLLATNAPEGGALFTIRLPLATGEGAA